MRIRMNCRPLALSALLLISSAPLYAQNTAGSDNGWRWIIRGAREVVSMEDESTLITPDESVTLGVENGNGWRLDLEYLVTRKIGIELAVFAGELDTSMTVVGGGMTSRTGSDTKMEVFSLGANYHFTRDARADVFAGAFIANSYFDGTLFEFEDPALDRKLAFDADFGFGIRAGVDFPVTRNSHWILSLGLRYLSTVLETEMGGNDVDGDAVMGSLGVGYRF